MILSPGCSIPQHKGRDMARGAKTLSKTQQQSISVLPHQPWLIIPAALILVHEQNNEIRVNKVIYLTFTKTYTTCLCQTHRQNENSSLIQKNESSNFPHNGTFLPLKMLISHSLKCPYLHYKHCSQTLWKIARKQERNPTFCSSSIRDVQQPQTVFVEKCNARCLLQKKPAALQSDFTFSYSVTFRCWLWSWKDRSPEEYVTVVPQKIRVIPIEQPYIFKKSFFCRLCWAVWYTLQISQPHRTTRSSQNNQCFTICLTRCEQGSLQYDRDVVRCVEDGWVPRQKEFKLLPN